MSSLVALALPLAFARVVRRAAPRPRLERFLSAPLGGKRLPFAEAVRVGGLLFVSGTIGNKPGTLELVPGGIAAETRQMMENVGRVLTKQGATFSDLVKCTVFLADIGEWPAMNEVYVTFFPPDAFPARTAIGAELVLGARVEIECLAVLPEK